MKRSDRRYKLLSDVCIIIINVWHGRPSLMFIWLAGSSTSLYLVQSMPISARLLHANSASTYTTSLTHFLRGRYVLLFRQKNTKKTNDIRYFNCHWFSK